jgi:RimJ/RimL family protein N-acetyltransferase
VPPQDLPTSRLLNFRQMTMDDLDAMAALLGDADVMRFYPRPKTRAEARAWIEWTLGNYARDGFGLWVIEDPDGEFLGDCGLTWQTLDGAEDLEIGYHVVPARQGLGIATEGARACRDFARGRGVERLIAITAPENRPSQRVAEKVGMRWERSTTKSGVPVFVHGMSL